MSQPKKDRVSHLSETKKIEAALIKGVVQHLRKIGGANTSAVKRIARETGINPRTVKAWYEGRNIPNLCGFIHLARRYPELMNLFLSLCQPSSDKLSVRGADHLSDPEKNPRDSKPELSVETTEHVGNNVGNQNRNVACNSRQLWFMLQLQEGAMATAEALASCWRVSVRTAERDITGLRKSGLIGFTGSKRTGYYQLL